ncbi:MAG: VWA domain-containing protein [Gemmataceae bacterium]|nr:VWA domain-containing protein [Gemmataceae bacterium]
MAQLAHPVDPFGEVNVYRSGNGRLDVVATILIEPDIEGARAGLALDGSASMQANYGANLPALFARAGGAVNVVEPVARTMAAYLARFSSSGRANLIYWACSPDGSQIEPLGEFSEEALASLPVRGPKKWGRGTRLLPPLRYFVEEAFRAAPWAICVFVTDGRIEDLDQVKQYSWHFARQIASGQRRFIKLVLLGVGKLVDEAQMEELDDMFEGNELRDPDGETIDLWDHKIAENMHNLAEIFAEVVSEKIQVADHGRVRDNAGRLVKEYPQGLPALLRFALPPGATAFILDWPGGTVRQDITEGLARL